VLDSGVPKMSKMSGLESETLEKFGAHKAQLAQETFNAIECLVGYTVVANVWM